MAFQVLVGATLAGLTDVTAYTDIGSILLKETGHSGIATADFSLIAPPVTPLPEWAVRVLDGGVKAFEGKIKNPEKASVGSRSSTAQKVFNISCQDNSSYLTDDVVDDAAGLRQAVETDQARVIWLITTYSRFLTAAIPAGGFVQNVFGTMPAQDLRYLNLWEALEEICAITGAKFYVDYDAKVHYFNTESAAAPFNLSDAPNDTTTFGYRNLALPAESYELTNAVLVVGGEGTTPVWRPDPATWPTASHTTYGRREGVLRLPDETVQANLVSAGDAFISAFGTPSGPTSLDVFRPGLRAGQITQLTNAMWGIVAQSYPIVEWQARPILDDRNLVYSLVLGSKPIDLGAIISEQRRGVASAAAAIPGSVQAALADLSIGGANIVRNSSFEDGSIWTVGAQWVIGYTPVGGELPAFGSKTARLTLAAQTAGDLVTPKITIDRTANWTISWWKFLRSRTSGTFRGFIKEYNAANTLLATTNIDDTTVDADYVRTIQRIGPVSEVVGMLAFQATTAKIEIGFNSAGAAATLSVDVDGVQLERGDFATAYAPAPQELVAGSITATEIADGAVTTPKVIAEAITAEKIAGSAITADKLAATIILGSLIRTGEANNRVEMDSEGFRVYNSAGDLLVNMPTDDSPVYVNAEIVASTLQVIGNSIFRGVSNVVAAGAALIIGSKVEAPDAKPTLAAGWETLSVPYDAALDYSLFPDKMIRYGLAYDAAGGAGGATKVFWTISARGPDLVLLEMLATTRAVNRSVVVHAASQILFAGLSVVRHSTWVYVLYFDFAASVWVVKRYVAATMALANTYTVNMTGLAGRYPRITSDGTNLYIVDVTSAGRVKWNKYDATMTIVGATIDTGWNLAAGDYIRAAYAGNADFGAFRLVAVSNADQFAYVWNATPTFQTNEAFPVTAGVGGLAYGDALGDGARFWHMPAEAAPAAFLIRKHTTWVWTTASSTYWVAYSWYDSVATVHETTVGPRASIDMGRRQRLIVTGIPVPVGTTDDPDKRRVYALPNATAPATTALKLQGETAAGSLVLTDYNAAGAAPPVSNNFPVTTPGEIRSANSEFEFRGDGTIALELHSFDPLFVNEGTATFSNDVCQWYRIGQVVFFRLVWTVTANGSGANPVGATNTGLPQAASNVVVVGDRGGTNVTRIIGRFINAGGELTLGDMRNLNGYSIINGNNLANTEVYSFHGMYIAA